MDNSIEGNDDIKDINDNTALSGNSLLAFLLLFVLVIPIPI